MIVTNNNKYKRDGSNRQYSCMDGFPAAINKPLHQERWFTTYDSRRVTIVIKVTICHAY